MNQNRSIKMHSLKVVDSMGLNFGQWANKKNVVEPRFVRSVIYHEHMKQCCGNDVCRCYKITKNHNDPVSGKIMHISNSTKVNK